MFIIFSQIIQYKYVYEKTNMQVTDSGTYGVLATYDGIGSSGLVTVTTSVVGKFTALKLRKRRLKFGKHMIKKLTW